MGTFIHAIETALPKHVYPQALTRDLLRGQQGLSRLSQRLVGSIFNASGIEQRFSAVGEMERGPGEAAGLFYDPATRQMLTPSTGERNDFYAEQALPLFVAAARKALAATRRRWPLPH